MRFVVIFFVFISSLNALPVRGIVLLENKEDLIDGERLKGMEGIYFDQIDLPGSEKELAEQLVGYLGATWNEALEKRITRIIYQYYREEGYPFILIDIPDQDRADEILQVVITYSRLGSFEVQGSPCVNPKMIRKYFCMKEGEIISSRAISKGVNFVNRNQFRRAEVIYSPGKEENTTDITIYVQEKSRYHIYAGADNTGVETTGRLRIFAGINLDQIFGLDHSFSYQYTTNDHVNRFHGNFFQYNAFLPNRNVLMLYGGYSVVHAALPTPTNGNKGTNIQGSWRYEIPLLAGYLFSQDLFFGMDVKNTNNTIQFTETFPQIGQTVNLTQGIVGYRARWERKSLVLKGTFEVVFSPLEWLPDQTDANFSSLRPNATNTWVYLNMVFNAEGVVKKHFSYRLMLRGQWTQEALLPSEQLGIGGFGSVRGYDSRQYNVDSGGILNLEIYLPSFSLFPKKNWQDAFSFLVFLDMGGGWENKQIPETPSKDILAGMGPGIRYQVGSYWNARLDWGFKLHDQPSFTGGRSMLQFSVTGTY